MDDSTPSALERLHRAVVPDTDLAWFFEDRTLFKTCPELFNLLSARRVGDKDRQPGKLSFFVDEGTLKAGIFLPSEARMAFVTLDSVSGAFEQIEALLASDKLDWRRDTRNGKPRFSRA